MTKKVLIFTSKEGHLSIAQSCSKILKRAGFLVKIVNLFSPKSFLIYDPFYRYFPSLFKVPYKIGKKEKIQKGVKIFVEKLLKKEVKKEVKKEQPDLIISTNLFYNPAIAKILDYQKIPIPFINILVNPWNIHPLELSTSADFNLAYDEKGVKIGQKHKIPKEKLLPIGWLIRKQFYQKHNLTKIRKGLDFKKNIFTLLICGGSEGTNSILKIIPAFLNIKSPIQIMVVCGTNKTLYKALSSINNLLSKSHLGGEILRTPRENLRIKIFKFTNKLQKLMSISDLVIGKAGPNLIFETVACKKPFFAICHISGQEDANLDLIRKKGLGFVEENPIKAIKLLQKIINNPKMLKKFSPHIQKERDYNLQAGKKLIEVAKALI